MRKFGLIGYPLGHSFSQKYFTEKFKRESIPDCVYLNFQLDNVGLLEDLVRDSELCGLNVTIPYKTQVIRYLSEIDNDAAQVGAVNVIRISGDKDTRRLKGFNSDIYGFRESIIPHLRKKGEKALILGTGGASMAVGYVFRALGIDFLKVSILNEPGTIRYNEITGDLLTSYRVIVNTTPLGMFPETTTFPDIPYHLLTKEHLLYDLVYNPEITEFMAKGKKMGCTVIGGLGMLHLQAEKSWTIWNDPAV
jgi:shikimate dehydrogenase